ncbi:protein CYCLOPS-like [Pyrus x bretschneideri]|uniref:protein CYCLOPS-like n=1 Tax=Pyrus x bretschneideri TaxID=225117 RepID=UPI00202EDBE8|nr:protein CYCLOPS-like [Pyrus x bretschneideri]
MVNEGIKGSSVNDSIVKPESSRQKLINALAIPRSEGQEMEGRRFSDFYRNTSEELSLRSYMESPVAMPLPTMEMLGFKNLSQNFRTDSEELFKSWLTNGEASSSTNCHNSSSIAHRTRSRMISTEIASSPGQQHVGILQKKRSNDCLYPPINTMPDEISGDNNQSSIRHGVERGIQASELYLAKAWFHSSQPMTRSRSSELRRRYVAMQNAQMPAGLEVMQTASGNSNLANQDFAFSNGFNDPSICEVSNQLATFISPSNSSSSTFNTPLMSEMDKVSSVVSMLKGTLERKKLSNQIEKQSVDDDRSNGRFSVQEVSFNTGFDQGERDQLHDMAAGTFQEISTIQVNGHRITQNVEGSLDIQMEGFVNITNPNPISRTSQERSQSESSAAAPVVSSGFDACDGPSNSGQTLSICESSIKRAESSRSKDVRERIIGNLKDDQKSGKRLDRYGSVTSAVSVDKEDATKKRRVERSRKMAEAKGRNSTPVIPSDMQSVLKRCENLEKEVRSLKLNLSFMNRKDSEQTTQIEELQKQNEDLMDEKERLVEEIERVLSETGKV